MTPAVTFNYQSWIALFPELAGVGAAQAQAYFNMANLYFANSESNPVFAAAGVDVMATMLDLVTAHIAWLLSPRDQFGKPNSGGSGAAPGIVGRVSSASEGSVSVSAEWKGSGNPSEEWWIQTPYGAAFWQATAPYRTFRYAANPTVVYTGGWPGRSTWRGR